MRARTRAFTGLFVAVVGLGTAGLLMASDRRSRETPQKELPTIPVAVAARDLDIGSVLTAADVRIAQWPANVAPSGNVSNATAVVGRGVVTPIRRDEPLLLHRLTATGASAGLPVLIEPGSRAMTVRVDDVIGIAGFVQPGSFVDVLVTSANNGQTRAGVILEGVKVLATGSQMMSDAQRAAQSKSSASGSSSTTPEPSSAVITLLVTPRQAEQLAVAAAEGRIQLALRNPLDQGLSATTATSMSMLPAPVTPSRPSPRPSAARPSRPASNISAGAVEVISGNKRAVTSIRDTSR